MPAKTTNLVPASLAVFLLLVLLMWDGTIAMGETLPREYTVNGTLNYALHIINGRDILLKFGFKVANADGRWQITTTDLGKGNEYTMVYDSTNLAYCGQADLESAKWTLVENIPVPKDWAASEGYCVWLAYASGNYFRNLTNSQAYTFEDIQNPNGRLGRCQEPCQWVLLTDAPWLPESANYFRNGKHILLNDGRWEFDKYGPPFQNGFVDIQYRAGTITNVNNLSFPLSFEYRKYVAHNANGGSTPDCVLVVDGTATNISVGKAMVQKLPDNILVEDERVMNAGVEYVNLGGAIPPTNAPAVGKALQRVLDAARLKPAGVAPPSHPGNRTIIYLIFTLPTVLLLHLIFNRNNSLKER